jgi:hypothetical protein
VRGAARHDDAAARRDVDLGLVDAEGQRAFEHAPRFVVAIWLAGLPEADSRNAASGSRRLPGRRPPEGWLVEPRRVFSRVG